jgi:hypothetical protein
MNYIGPKAVLLCECASVDEMTIGFQGSHKDKRRITYKAEGDGFQCDALCQEGYCYQHYFRNDPAPIYIMILIVYYFHYYYYMYVIVIVIIIF